jgi:hypothetical protein
MFSIEGRFWGPGDCLPTDEDIRELCARVIKAKDLTEFQTALDDLQIAMREHATGAGNRNARILLQMRRQVETKKDGTDD